MTTLLPPRGILLVVSGAAGTGKGTVTANLLKNHEGYAFSVSATTRPPRPGEVDGREYRFITKEAFEKEIREGNVIEYTYYCGNYYGTMKSELSKLDDGKNLILEIEVEGAMNIKRLFPEAVTVFVLPPDYETLRARLVGRGTNTADDIENRMKKALTEFSLIGQYDYAVVNRTGHAEEAAATIAAIVESEKHRVFRTLDDVKRLFPAPED